MRSLLYREYGRGYTKHSSLARLGHIKEPHIVAGVMIQRIHFRTASIFGERNMISSAAMIMNTRD